MSDRDDTTGQFTADEPMLTGVAGIERDSGYIPLPDPSEQAAPDELTVDQAAEMLGLVGTSESEIRSYADGDSYDDPVENPKETVTLERAGKEAEAYEARIEEPEQQDRDDALRKEIDELRGAKPEAEQAPVEISESDPKFREAVAVEAANHAKEAEEVKQRYSAAIENADQIASAAFRARFPELAAQPIEQWQNVLSTMPPARAQEAVGTLQHLMQVKSVLQQQQAQQAETERARFKAASDQLEAKIKDVPRARRAEVESEIIDVLKERNSDLGNAAQFLRGIQGSDVAMELLWELGDVRSQLKALKSAPKAVAKANLPPVQRPGTTVSRESVAYANVQMLERRFNQTRSEKDGWALLQAKQRGRG
jgi:hypothetical protein